MNTIISECKPFCSTLIRDLLLRERYKAEHRGVTGLCLYPLNSEGNLAKNISRNVTATAVNPNPCPRERETVMPSERLIRWHNEAELLRLRHGFEGCACSICQDLYRRSDLSCFGSRVKTFSDFTLVVAGTSGADLHQEFTEDGELIRKALAPAPVRREPVTKTECEETVTDNYVTPLKRRGRPVKNGEVSKRTEYRRKAEQMVLL